MAHLDRSAKSGSDWTRSDLDSYHITIHQEDHLLFFGLQVSRGKLRIRHWEELHGFYITGVATTCDSSRAAGHS